mmetsp:Transcript_78910/g.218321  ORF Transcript_78910/g.218321 Transcript_78910/m.218321 type:complete len:204 (+) Transcript_78910:433-1044(+)
MPWALEKPSPQSSKAAAMTPQKPHTPCTAKASTGSSILATLVSAEATTKSSPPTAPMTRVQRVSTTVQPALMETRPTRTPLHMLSKSHLLMIANRRQKLTIPPTAAASVAFVAACAAWKPCSMPFMDMVEPQMRPYQPNQSTKVPKAINSWLWGTKSCGWSPLARCLQLWPSKRPLRWPAKRALSRAPTPPTKWTTPLPAKSR